MDSSARPPVVVNTTAYVHAAASTPDKSWVIVSGNLTAIRSRVAELVEDGVLPPDVRPAGILDLGDSPTTDRAERALRQMYGTEPTFDRGPDYVIVNGVPPWIVGIVARAEPRYGTDEEDAEHGRPRI